MRLHQHSSCCRQNRQTVTAREVSEKAKAAAPHDVLTSTGHPKASQHNTATSTQTAEPHPTQTASDAAPALDPRGAVLPALIPALSSAQRHSPRAKSFHVPATDSTAATGPAIGRSSGSALQKSASSSPRKSTGSRSCLSGKQ